MLCMVFAALEALHKTKVAKVGGPPNRVSGAVLGRLEAHQVGDVAQGARYPGHQLLLAPDRSCEQSEVRKLYSPFRLMRRSVI